MPLKLSGSEIVTGPFGDASGFQCCSSDEDSGDSAT
jgi:hypothetical protein